MKKSDWRVHENSNAPFCFGGLNKYITTEVSKDYWLRYVYPEDISKAYVNGYIHIHDLGGLSLYCCGYSLESIMQVIAPITDWKWDDNLATLLGKL